MASKKQLRYIEILTHVRSFNNNGISPTVEKVFEQHYTNRVIIHTIRSDLKNLVKDGKLSMKKVRGAFQFTVVKSESAKPQINTNKVLCDNCKREINIPKIFCFYCKREVKEGKRYYKKSCCDDCKSYLKEWRKQK